MEVEIGIVSVTVSVLTLGDIYILFHMTFPRPNLFSRLKFTLILSKLLW